LLAFDNVSGLPIWLSDALCRLASGGSFAVRRLYTDDEEVLLVLFEAARPILLNGIDEVISRTRSARVGWRPPRPVAAHGRFRERARCCSTRLFACDRA
jgi:hypothetical protein